MTPQTSPIRDKRMDTAVTSLVSDSGEFCFTNARRARMQVECQRHSELFRKVIAEIIGTFFLMFCVCGVSMGDSISHGGMDIMNHAIAAAFTIMVIIFSIGSISGAHVNPAVTIAFASIKQFPWSQVPFYVVAQLLGAILGTLLAKVLYNQQVDVLTQPGGSIYRAFFMEILISFEFMFLAVAVTSHGRAANIWSIHEPCKVPWSSYCYESL
eukprot:c5095_g1_i2 orf=427-1062(+)